MLASITSHLTGWIADQGVYAVFALMAVDALVPVGGELIMVYAGVVAAGAVAGGHPTFLGMAPTPGLESYLVLAMAGALGYLAGSLAGWVIGARGGRAIVERHGRWLHLSPRTLDRAEAWFDRFGSRAVLLGRITPVVRSFISVPAGILGSPLREYTMLTLLGSLIWCFAFAGAGWAAGGSWESFHHAFRYADYAVAAGLAVVLALAVARRRRARRPAS
ncbi:MAG: DedA family protein [Solirubrobacterales bacterium]|nr:DedA family protein [Solirubrobacterales bacterium]